MAVAQPEERPFCALSVAGEDGKGAKGRMPGTGSIGRVDRVNPSPARSESSSRDLSGDEPSVSQLPVSQPSVVGVPSAPRAPVKDPATMDSGPNSGVLLGWTVRARRNPAAGRPRVSLWR